MRERAQTAAALVMWASTGRRYGACPVEVMPSVVPCVEPLYQTFAVLGGSGLAAPVLEGGVWYNRPSGGDGPCCRRGVSCEVPLDGPTTKAQITAVTIDGVTVDSDAYVVVDGWLLTRVDGQCWPSCPSVPGPAAFTVSYTVGLPIPAAVQRAFERLACEFAQACTGGACALPQRMTRLTRQGVEMELEEVDVTEGLAGLTGVKEVDDVIRAVNPHRLTAPPAVLSPDMPMPRRLT